MKSYLSASLQGIVLLLFSLGLAAADSVVINEIMYHPTQPADGGPEPVGLEYIELLNSGPTPVRLDGWRFSRGVIFTFPPMDLGPSEYLVIAANLPLFRAKYPTVTNVIGSYVGTLGNTDKTLQLDDALAQVIDRVHYADEGAWAVRRKGPVDNGARGWEWYASHDGLGRSLELMNPALPNDYGQNWGASTVSNGTPGRENSIATTNRAPLIVDASHSPLIPTSQERVLIVARIFDEDLARVTVALHYRLHTTTQPGPFLTVPMADDGLIDDGIAGNGLFGARVPAQSNGSVVEFYISAQDALGHEQTWPAPALNENLQPIQAANALYQVDETLYTGSQPILRLVLTGTERQTLKTMSHLSSAEFNGTLISDDGVQSQLRYEAGIRYRGASTRDTPVPNMRISIPSDRRWEGVVALNANTYYAYAQLIGSALSLEAGLTVPFARPIQLRLNSVNPVKLGTPSPLAGDGFGTLALVEVVDGDWASNHFPLDGGGNIYSIRGRGGDLTYHGTNWISYLNNSYSKSSNTGTNDWSDLANLTRILQNAPDSNYVQQVEEVLDPLQWARYFAINAVLGNSETCIATGFGDDYDLYRGLTDIRFKMVPHDWDSILLEGLSQSYNEDIFLSARLPVVSRFLKHPSFVPLFYSELKRLLDTSCSASQLESLIDERLGGFVPLSTRDSMKQYALGRATYIRSQIPLQLTATNALPLSRGYFRTTTAQIALFGFSDALRTRTVRVDGVLAEWTAWQGRWTNRTVTVTPGINRILVESLDAQGKTFDKTTVTVWYDAGSQTTVAGGTLTGDTLWTAAASPYYVATPLTIPAGKTLTLQAGTRVQFAPTTYLAVGGVLHAEGTEQHPIRFTSSPSVGGYWNGIKIDNSTQDNRVINAVFEQVGPSTPLEIHNSSALLDGIDFITSATCIYFTNASLIIRRSHFPKMIEREAITGYGILPGGQLILDSNHFEGTTGYNDIIDYTGGRRPGPIIQVYNNLFEYGADDALDLDGTDAHIEGNVFRHMHRDAPRESLSCGIATDTGSEITVVRNIFYHCDNGIQLKNAAYGRIENNTFVGCTQTAIVFGSTNKTVYPGRGADLDGNIFWNNAELFSHDNDPGVSLTIRHSILQGTPAPGEGNLIANPLLVDATNDFHLRAGSAAVAAGPNHLDMGAYVPSGASIAGEPSPTTASTSATLTVGGPGITRYRYRVNGGAFSVQAYSVSNSIALSNLIPGSYQVEVIGENSAGIWQSTDVPTLSRQWTVNSGLQSLRINEILAKNQITSNHFGTFPDLVEFHNSGAADRDMSGMQLTDDPAVPGKFTFPAGTHLAPGGYWVVFADKATGAPGIHLGFSIGTSGDALYLYAPAVSGGQLLDSVVFGLQLADLSLSRLEEGGWSLGVPSFGGANTPVNTADPSALRINEWLATGAAGDFVEIYNPLPVPVGLGGLALTDNPIGWPDRSVINPLSFIAPGGYQVFKADGSVDKGPDHLSFGLNYEVGWIGLLDDKLNLIDSVTYASQLNGVSQGRLSADSAKIVSYFQPSPGTTNVFNLPPALRITSPASGTPLNLPGDVLIGVEASDTDGFITRVEFYQSTRKIGESLAAPFGFLWTGVPQGAYTLIAQAFDNSGNHTYSAPVQINPQSPSLALDIQPSGSVYPLGTPMTLIATPSNLPGNVSSVQFYANGGKIAESTTSPYNFTWLSTTSGVFNLRAIALAGTLNYTSIVATVRLLNSQTNEVTLIPKGAVWSYLDTGVDLSNRWSRLDFDESLWKSGPAQLGYGESDEATVVGFGPNAGDKYITTYFRHRFNGPIDPGWTDLSAALLRDDGAVVYVNGEEAERSNMPAGPIGYRTQAGDLGGVENIFIPFSLSTSNLFPGPNVIAIEVHQNQIASSDLSFDFELKASLNVIEPYLTGQPVTVQINAGANTQLSVTAMGRPLWAQWYRVDQGPVTGANLLSLVFNAVEPAQAGGYYLVLTNALGSVTSTVAQVSVALVDTDHDGIPDYWEERYGLNPNNPADAALDSDGDGLTNLQEYSTGSDPTVPDLVLLIVPVVAGNKVTAVKLQFQAKAGTAYRIEQRSTLDLSWQTLRDIPAKDTAQPTEFLTPVLTSTRFYRVIVP